MAPEPVRLGAWVRYPKEEVFEICGALALAEVVLRRLGHEVEAARMAAVFDLAEGGLAGAGPPAPIRPAPGPRRPGVARSRAPAS